MFYIILTVIILLAIAFYLIYKRHPASTKDDLPEILDDVPPIHLVKTLPRRQI